VTTLHILKACSSTQDVNAGRQIHSEITCKGFLESNIAVGIALIDMYGKCGFFWEAEQVFDNLVVQDTVAWNALLTSYVEHKHCEDVFDCLESMQMLGVPQDSVTFLCVLKACGTLGVARLGQELQQEVEKGKLLERDSVVRNALLDMYVKCGLIGNAQELFENLPFRDVVTYTALVTGYCQLGDTQSVFRLLYQMLIEGIVPNSVTFIGAFGVCCHGGLVEKGEILFHAMCDMYRIDPSPQHLTCMVDLLGRAGQLEKAVELIRRMSFLVDDSVWHSVLAACRRSGNLAVGKQAFQHALGLDEKDVTAFVSFSNLYLDAGIEEME
jgi:pentatricopeptide repeat protein